MMIMKIKITIHAIFYTKLHARVIDNHDHHHMLTRANDAKMHMMILKTKYLKK